MNKSRINNIGNEHTESEVRMNRTAPMIFAVVLSVVLSGYFAMNRRDEPEWTPVNLNGAITVQKIDGELFISYQGMSQRVHDLTFEIEGIEIKVEDNSIFYRTKP